jgi:hypothetical protein
MQFIKILKIRDYRARLAGSTPKTDDDPAVAEGKRFNRALRQAKNEYRE